MRRRPTTKPTQAPGLPPSSALLSVQEVSIPAGEEWCPQAGMWTFLELTAGVAYWTARTGAIQLARDDAFVVTPGNPGGHLLASRVEDSRIRFLLFDPVPLKGLLTLGESNQMDWLGSAGELGAWHWPRGTPDRDRVAMLLGLGKCGSLRDRLRVLTAVIELLQARFPTLDLEAEGSTSVLVKDRVQRVLNQTTESELVRLTVSDLASRLHCSPRHFSRVFSLIHGVSFRDKQQEVRLAAARRLLETGDDKILNVALESGYQSLGLFNALFKRRHGMTPSEYRRLSQKQGVGRVPFRRDPPTRRAAAAAQPVGTR